MKNKLTDLNNHLFTQLERLNDEDMSKNKELLNLEIERSRAITSVAKEIISNARLVLDAHNAIMDAPEMIKVPGILQ